MYDFLHFPILETERLTLRRMLPGDAAALAAVLGDPAVVRYLVDLDMPHDSESAVLPIIQWADAIFAAQSGLRWAISLKAGDGALIGTCGFHVWNRANRRIEMGYELASAHWRQGIMREALRRIIPFAFEDLAVHRIEADVTQGNLASAGLLRSLGFQQEGTWRERVYFRDQYYDLWQFGLLKEEYEHV